MMSGVSSYTRREAVSYIPILARSEDRRSANMLAIANMQQHRSEFHGSHFRAPGLAHQERATAPPPVAIVT
jgi:hypothetical protein